MTDRKPKSLGLEDAGAFAELAGRPNPEGLVIVFTPSLGATFARAEHDKGRRLTRTEVVGIGDCAPAIAVTTAQAAALMNERGYEDVDPVRPYESWLRMHAD